MRKETTPSAVPAGEYGDRIARGAAWLDENVPTWRARLDLGELQIYSCSKCILGQLFGDFEDAPSEVADYAEEFGFNVKAGVNYGARTEDLTREWVAHVEATR